ncbi:MAG: OsmC family peroxiredoxin [Alphaproteobacteria bacterium]|nr:MAG: OsmC family peroxiredoxin [Alphaproteobacteria bacterium]
MSALLEYTVSARRVNGSGSVANVRDAEVVLDTSLAGRADALNPAELLLAALAACMIKGAERVAPMLHFELRGMSVRLHAVRADAPPSIKTIDYEIVVESDEPERRLELLHTNIRKFGTISNTLAGVVQLTGVIRRADTPA